MTFEGMDRYNKISQVVIYKIYYSQSHFVFVAKIGWILWSKGRQLIKVWHLHLQIRMLDFALPYFFFSMTFFVRSQVTLIRSFECKLPACINHQIIYSVTGGISASSLPFIQYCMIPQPFHPCRLKWDVPSQWKEDSIM